MNNLLDRELHSGAYNWRAGTRANALSSITWWVINRIELLFAGAFLLLGMHANVKYLQSDPGWALVYVLAALFLLRTIHFPKLYLPLNLSTLSLTSYMILMAGSITWSAMTWSSARAVVALLGTTMLGVYLANRFSIASIIRLLFCVLVIVLLSSLLVAVWVPSVGEHSESANREWRGIILHKSALGVEMALLLSLTITLVRWRKISVVIGILIAVLSALVLYKSDSLEGQLLAIVLIVLSLMIPRVSKHSADFRLMARLAVLSILGVLVVLAPFLGRIVASNPPVLSGRPLIWAGVIDSLMTKPILGFGYGGYWHGESGPSILVAQAIPGYVPYHAHNGPLEIMLAGGLVGLSLFGVFALRFLMNGWTLLVKSPGLDVHVFVIFAAFVALQSIVSIAVPGYQTSTWVLMVTFALKAEDAVRQSPRLRRRSDGAPTVNRRRLGPSL